MMDTRHLIFIFLLISFHDFRAKSLQLLPLRRRGKKANIATFWKNRHSEKLQNIKEISIALPRNKTGAERQRFVDEYIMDMAMEQGREAGNKYSEVPIGAIVAKQSNCDIDNDEILAIDVQILSEGQNQIETTQDASAHAEIQALRRAGTTVNNWRLLNATLYSTLEPCPMCLSACQAFRVSRIVYGAQDLRLGAVETYMNLLEYDHPFHNNIEVVGGVRGEEAKELLVSFFRERRKKGKRSISDENAEQNKDLGTVSRLWKRLKNPKQ